MTTPRFLHTATLLPGGKVLVAGGCSQTRQEQSKAEAGWTNEQLASSYVACAEQALPTTETYDPKKRKWSAGTAMHTPRLGHFAVLIPSGPVSQCGSQCGKVLVGGGDNAPGQLGRSVEVYDPSARKWSLSQAPVSLTDARAAVMPSGPRSVCGRICGKVVVILQGGPRGQAMMQLYDPASGKWREGPKPPLALNGGHSATLMKSGRILLRGGIEGGAGISAANGYQFIPAKPAMYDPVGAKWTTMRGETVFRDWHSATSLKDGRALIAGGIQPGSDNIVRSTELLSASPKRPIWKAARALAMPRHNHVAVALKDGRVMVLGGDSTKSDYHGCETQANPNLKCSEGSAKIRNPEPEIYDPVSGKWSTGPKGAAYRGSTRPVHLPVFTATVLANGELLVAGGIAEDDKVLSSTDIYVPGRVRGT